MKILNKIIKTLSIIATIVMVSVLSFNIFISYLFLEKGQITEEFMKLGIATLFSFLLLLVIFFLIRKREKPKETLQSGIVEEESIEEKENKTANNFLANMSHELRTPLNGILGFTDILKDTKLDNEQKEFVSIIQDSSKNLLNIVNDILDFSKVESGKMELENIPFNPIEKFELTIESYSAKVAQKKIELGLYIDPSLPTTIMGDPTKLSQVILNLLSNAIKFTDRDGMVNVAIEKVSETKEAIDVEFSVKDSGKGIEEDKIETIFEAFSQASVSTNREFGGTGLGLTISSQFVELMGGKLEIKSKINQGTTFFFTVSLKKPAHAKSKVISHNFRQKVGYIIPKNQNFYQDIDKTLEIYVKYTGSEFKIYDQEEIFNIKESELPDILYINDRYTPDEKLLHQFFALKTKIVLITCADNQKISSLYQNRINDFILKPINLSKILKSIKHLSKLKDDDFSLVKLKSKPSDSKEFYKESTKETNKQQKIDNDFHCTKLEVEPNNRDKPRILVAEDNMINQKLLLSILKNMEVETTLAHNGLEALEEYKESRFDIILMDIQMPIMTGLESTQKIIEYEKENQLTHTPIIALTANNLQSDIKNYLKNGMDDYLNKPIQIDKLKSMIQKYSKKETKKDIEISGKNVLLYKETEVAGKIYSAMLQNFGYSVDSYHLKDEFKEQIKSDKYQLILFDTQVSDNIEETIKMLKNSKAKAFAFTKNPLYKECCNILVPQIYGEELKKSLEVYLS